MRGHLLTTSGQRLERQGIGDFIDIVYAYAVNGSEGRTWGRNAFIEYIHDLKPNAEKMAEQPFDTQAMSMIDDLDAFRAGFGNE